MKDDLFSEVPSTDNNLLLIQAVCHRNRTYSRIPAAALPDFINIVRPALEVMVGALNRGNDELFTQALQSFLIIPQFALVKNPKETASEVRHKIYQFSEGPNEAKATRKRKRDPAHVIPPDNDIDTLPPCKTGDRSIQVPNGLVKQRKGRKE